MITQKTVLVLGAGASMPYGFPSGLQLLEEIYQSQPGDWGILPTLARCGFGSGQTEPFLQALAGSGQRSVDRFLGLRPEFAEIGKAAIVSVIGRFEQAASLFAPRGERGQWYELLFERLQSPVERWGENRLSIVTLNYDRSFEQFMTVALSNSYGVSRAEAVRMLSRIPVIHPHGSLGSLDPLQANYRFFGQLVEPSLVREAASDVRVLHEGVMDSPEFLAARQLIHDAELVLVLGMAYEDATVKRLGLDTLESQNRAYGTAFGLERIEFDEARGRCNGRVSMWQNAFDIRRFLRAGPIAIT